MAVLKKTQADSNSNEAVRQEGGAIASSAMKYLFGDGRADYTVAFSQKNAVMSCAPRKAPTRTIPRAMPRTIGYGYGTMDHAMNP